MTTQILCIKPNKFPFQYLDKQFWCGSKPNAWFDETSMYFELDYKVWKFNPMRFSHSFPFPNSSSSWNLKKLILHFKIKKLLYISRAFWCFFDCVCTFFHEWARDSLNKEIVFGKMVKLNSYDIIEDIPWYPLQSISKMCIFEYTEIYSKLHIHIQKISPCQYFFSNWFSWWTN